MQKCGRSHGNTLNPCPCNGPFHTQPNHFKMLFSGPFDHESASPTVDCTLSLGTPSTRAEKCVHNTSRVTNFCWDLLQVKQVPFQPQTPPQSCYRVAHVSRNDSVISNTGGGGEPMLARRCANCDTTSTPLWRNGPRGPKSLCNACGIRFKKEERRGGGTCTITGNTGATLAATESHHQWLSLRESQKVPCFSPAIGNAEESGASIPFLSWRLNVTDRPSLVHDFTR